MACTGFYAIDETVDEDPDHVVAREVDGTADAEQMTGESGDVVFWGLREGVTIIRRKMSDVGTIGRGGGRKGRAGNFG